ncbi:MAG: hypothetical protein ABIG93_01800 [archaeon]|nr:hypothetical protein [Nanoarchaeota archaeon]
MTFKLRLNPRRSKKAQAEMIGLVIIVILITLGMLFMARFALKADPDKKVFTRKGLAYSTMSAIEKVEVNCYQGTNPSPTILSIGLDLIDDCAKHVGDPTSVFMCSSEPPGSARAPKHACNFTQDLITQMLNETLNEWGKNYQFSSVLVRGSGEELMVVENGGCRATSDRDSSGLFPIYVQNVGLVENTLYLCD